jgi:hypothetical protein
VIEIDLNIEILHPFQFVVCFDKSIYINLLPFEMEGIYYKFS